MKEVFQLFSFMKISISLLGLEETLVKYNKKITNVWGFQWSEPGQHYTCAKKLLLFALFPALS